MTRHEEHIRNSYFDWLVKIVTENRYDNDISYRKLLKHLYNTEFIYSIPRDSNRAEDGKDLRYRFSRTSSKWRDADLYLDGPCSVLEMMVALAIRCEESIMTDTHYGDRTGQWFWVMITSLGLGAMRDDIYDEEYVENCLIRFLNHDYEPNGKGGLFTIRGIKEDLRKVEIWYQLCWYLDTII